MTSTLPALPSSVHIDKLEYVINKHSTQSPTLNVEETCKQIIAEMYDTRKWTALEPDWYAVSKFNVYVSASGRRGWRRKMSGKHVPFCTEGETNWVVYVPTRMIASTTDPDQTCVVCKEHIKPGRMIPGCSLRHASHIDCYAVAKACHGPRACVGGMYEPCETPCAHAVNLGYDECRLFLGCVDTHLSTRPPTAETQLVTDLVRTARSWFPSHGHDTEAKARYVDTIDASKPCVMCNNEITEEGLVTCLNHHIHSHCYVLWRAMRDQAKCESGDETTLGDAECPGFVFGEPCVCSLKL